MPHSIEDKKKATTRLRRIKGQVEALERPSKPGPSAVCFSSRSPPCEARQEG